MTRLSNERMAELSAALRAKRRLPVRPGVLPFERGRVVIANEGGVAHALGPIVPWFMCADMALDLNDSATVGVLAGYARELWGDDGLYAVPTCDPYVAIEPPVRSWAVLHPNGQAAGTSRATRAEAWAEAILRAPERGES